MVCKGGYHARNWPFKAHVLRDKKALIMGELLRCSHCVMQRFFWTLKLDRSNGMRPIMTWRLIGVIYAKCRKAFLVTFGAP